MNEYLEELTTQILLDNDMLYKIPVNIIELANAYGINVYEGEFGNEVSGAIRYNKEEDKFEILVNKNNAYVRQRFTIAHELGHYFLHEEMLRNSDVHMDILYRATTQIDEKIKEQEKEVDYFAGALLMNKMILEKFIKGNSIAEIANMFYVSNSAMAVRLHVLEIL